MFETKRILTVILMSCFLFSLTGSAFAREFPVQYDVPLDKVWTIRFNKPIETENMRIYVNQGIYRNEELDFYVPVNSKAFISEDKKTVTVKPVNDFGEPGLYAANGTFTVWVSNTNKSIDGEPLKEPAYMIFHTAAE